MKRYSVAPSSKATVRPSATIVGDAQAGGLASLTRPIARAINAGTRLIWATALGSYAQHVHRNAPSGKITHARRPADLASPGPRTSRWSAGRRHPRDGSRRSRL